MLSKKEIERLLTLGIRVMADESVVKEAQSWKLFRITPQMLGVVYSFLKTAYREKDTLEIMERGTGISKDKISSCLKELEHYGYITISRTSKPFLYRVAK